MIDIETLSYEELVDLRDACNRKLLEMLPTRRRTLSELLHILEDVKVTLRDQGKQWRSLERWQWVDGEIRFWLNPVDQVNYQLGWYSIDELIAWTQNRGSVLRQFEDEDDEAELNEPGWNTENGPRITWLPEKPDASK
jgi:hypothetical protein